MSKTYIYITQLHKEGESNPCVCGADVKRWRVEFLLRSLYTAEERKKMSVLRIGSTRRVTLTAEEFLQSKRSRFANS